MIARTEQKTKEKQFKVIRSMAVENDPTLNGKCLYF